MTFLRNNYDRVAVLAGAVFLMLCAFFIWRSAASFQENFASLQPAGPPKTAAPTEKALELQAAVEKLRQPPQWTFGGRSGLFVPEKHFIGPDGLPATLQTTEIHPPVPNDWLEQYGLPIAETDVLTQDPDGDGFTNLDEWQGKTDPTNKASHPAYITKLKLKSANTEAFQWVFTSYAGGDFFIDFVAPGAPLDADGRVMVNTTERDKQTMRAHMSEEISRYDARQRKNVGTGFRVANFEEKHETVRRPTMPGGLDVDVSELTLENIATGKRITLVKDKPTMSPEAVATFVYTWAGAKDEMVFRKGEEFSLKPETGIRYKLVEVQPGRAVVVNTQKPEERIEIGPLTP